MNKNLAPYVAAIAAMLIYMTWRDISSSPRASIREEPVMQGEINNGVYTFEQIGWNITIPDGCDILPVINIDHFNKAIAQYNEAGIAIPELTEIKQLVGFQNGERNYFRSFYEIHPDIDEDHLMESMAMHREVVPEMFPSDCIITDVSSIRQEYIDNQIFLMFSYKVSTPKFESPSTIIKYMGIIDNGYFTATISSTNIDNRIILTTAWRNSKFNRLSNE